MNQILPNNFVISEWRPPPIDAMAELLTQAARKSPLPSLAQERRHLEEVTFSPKWPLLCHHAGPVSTQMLPTA